MWKWKTVLAGATALVIAGGGLALAQSGARTDTSRDQSRIEQIDARVDARLARLKTRLQLTAEQEKHWPAVETAVRDLAKQRAARIAERRTSRDGADLIQRMRGGADAMTARAAGLKQLADAIEPLYKSLDERQRRQIAALMRAGGDGARGRRHAGGRHFNDGGRGRGAHRHDGHGHRGHHHHRGWRDR